MLKLPLSDDKTKITNAKHQEANFLGFHITKFKSFLRILMDTDKLIRKLKDNGMCNYGSPIAMTKMQNVPIQDIIKYANEVLRGLFYGNQGCHNFHKAWRTQYMKATFKEYGDRLTVNCGNLKGIDKQISLALFRSFK
jgi:hypothetical protein